jgi:hypothetical protein
MTTTAINLYFILKKKCYQISLFIFLNLKLKYFLNQNLIEKNTIKYVFLFFFKFKIKIFF